MTQLEHEKGDAGMEIGAHTVDHEDLRTLTSKQQEETNLKTKL